MERPGAIGILAVEEYDAWRAYLEATQDQPLARYCEVEPWAWSRLGATLRAIHARRRAIMEDDGA